MEAEGSCENFHLSSLEGVQTIESSKCVCCRGRGFFQEEHVPSFLHSIHLCLCVPAPLLTTALLELTLLETDNGQMIINDCDYKV